MEELLWVRRASTTPLPTAGQSDRTIGAASQIQFALKLIFGGMAGQSKREAVEDLGRKTTLASFSIVY